MSDHKARALGITTEYETMCVSAGIGRPFGLAGLYLMIAVALRRVRRETLEECANLCERYRHDSQTLGAVPTDPMLAISVSAHEIAQAIRSLAVKEGEG